ncbi:MAG: hypothetical protein AAGA46_09455 [Cyanobacteria bacterium P01_F01_bin.13]
METPFAIRYNNIKLQVERLYKSADQANMAQFPGLEDVSFVLRGGECVHLQSFVPSADRLLLDALLGHVRIEAGAIWVDHQGQWLNLPQLPQRQAVRVQAIGYLGVSDSLRSGSTAMDCVLNKLLELGFSRTQADGHSRHVLDWVGLPRRLWHRALADLPLAGLHQVNLARTFAVDYGVIVVDLPMNHFDPANQRRLLELVDYRKAQNTCFIGRFEQADLRQQMCDRNLSVYVPTRVPIGAAANSIAVPSY